MPGNVTYTLPIEFKRSDSSSKFAVYCNATEVGFGPWDIRINIMESTTADLLTVHGTVVMAPLQAKALLQALELAVTMYEQRAGKLDPEKILANFSVNPKKQG